MQHNHGTINNEKRTNRASQGQAQNSIENLVFDFFVVASDAILQERRGITNPISTKSIQSSSTHIESHSEEMYADNADYCRRSLQPWRRDLSKPLVLDMYIYHPELQKHTLMERWCINYIIDTQLRDGRQFSIINRRILTLIRSLYCFVRLLPGFSVVNMSRRVPTLNFQLYEYNNITYPSTFDYEMSTYRFNKVSTSKGWINMTVNFISSEAVQDVLKSVNGGKLVTINPFLSQIQPEVINLAAPGNRSKPSQRRHSASIDTRSTHGNVSAAIPIPSAQEAYIGGEKGSTGSSLPTYSKSGPIPIKQSNRAMPSQHDAIDMERMPLNVDSISRPPPHQRQQSKSLESYADIHHHWGDNTASIGKSSELTNQLDMNQPSLSQYQGRGYQPTNRMSRNLTQQHSGSTATAAFLHANASNNSTPSISLSSQSSTSPPFSITKWYTRQNPLDVLNALRNGSTQQSKVLNEGLYQQTTQGAQLQPLQESPFAPFSTSLTSTSPHVESAMILMQERRQQQQHMLQYQQQKASSRRNSRSSPKSLDGESDAVLRDQSLRISSLPENPFTLFAKQKQQFDAGSANGGSGKEEKSAEGLSLATRLDNILMDESERRRRSDSNLSIDDSVSSFPFRPSDKFGLGRVSDETHPSMVGEDDFGEKDPLATADDVDDELPFAWGDADMMINTASSVAPSRKAATNSTYSGRKNITLPFGLSSKFSYNAQVPSNVSVATVGSMSDVSSAPVASDTAIFPASGIRDATAGDFVFNNGTELSEQLSKHINTFKDISSKLK